MLLAFIIFVVGAFGPLESRDFSSFKINCRPALNKSKFCQILVVVIDDQYFFEIVANVEVYPVIIFRTLAVRSEKLEYPYV